MDGWILISPVQLSDSMTNRRVQQVLQFIYLSCARGTSAAPRSNIDAIGATRVGVGVNRELFPVNKPRVRNLVYANKLFCVPSRVLLTFLAHVSLFVFVYPLLLVNPPPLFKHYRRSLLRVGGWRARRGAQEGAP